MQQFPRLGEQFSPEIGTTTTRVATSALLALDSEDRFANYEVQNAIQVGDPNWSPYDFTITKNGNLMSGFFTRLAVSEIVFPVCIPNIHFKCNKILVNYGATIALGTTIDIELTPAFYTPESLAAQLTVLLQTIPTLGAAVVEYGVSGRPEFSYNSGAVGAFLSFSPMPYNSAAYPFPNTTRQLFNVLGFNSAIIANPINNAATAYWTEAIGVNYYATGGSSFAQSCRYFDFVSNSMTYNQALKDATSQTITRDVLCRVYLGAFDNKAEVVCSDPTLVPPQSLFVPVGCAPSTIYRNFAVPKQIQWNPMQNLGQVQITVFDDEGSPLQELLPAELTPLNWSMSLLVSEN